MNPFQCADCQRVWPCISLATRCKHQVEVKV